LTNRDLSEALVVIAIEPNYDGSMQGWTAETGLVKVQQFRGLINDLEDQMIKLAPRELIASDEEIKRENYQIGPASQGPMVEILQIAKDVNDAMQSGVSYLDLGVYALGLGRWWRQRTGQTSQPAQFSGGIVYSIAMIEGLCVRDVVQRHAETRVLKLSSHSRQHYIGSPGHPTGYENYTVTVSVAKNRHYCYLVNGRAEVHDHFKISDDQVVPLQVPVWITDSQPGLSKEPIRPKSVDFTHGEV
jgi:hypothetical protein